MRRGWENWVLLLLHCSNLAAVTINYLSTTNQLEEDLGAALVFILLLSLFAASLTFVIVVVYYVIVSWPEKPEWEKMIPDEYKEKVLGNSDDDEEVRDLVARANEVCERYIHIYILFHSAIDANPAYHHHFFFFFFF